MAYSNNRSGYGKYGSYGNGKAPARRTAEEAKEARQATLRTVKGKLATDAVKNRFDRILGKRAAQFTASLVNVVSGSTGLLDCDPESIMRAAFVAATYDLPIDGNLGFSAIVPYKGKAQFQMMYKGFIQLAIRTGEYEKMGCAEVYEDELVRYNPITCECQFVDDFDQCKQRKNGEVKKIVGYYAWFRLKQGYTAELYMSREAVENHAKTYSQSYKYDLREGKKSSVWSTNFAAMAKKTVMKQLLSKWGILSIEMQRAIQDDQKVYEASGEGTYADNQDEFIPAEDPFDAGDVVDADFREVAEENSGGNPGQAALPEEAAGAVLDAAVFQEKRDVVPVEADVSNGASEEPEELDIEAM